jgi:hypothetical protein
MRQTETDCFRGVILSTRLRALLAHLFRSSRRMQRGMKRFVEGADRAQSNAVARMPR